MFWRVAFKPDGKLLATSSFDHTARIWDIATGQELARFTHTDEVRGLAFSPDGTRLATGSSDGVVRIWTWPHTKIDPAYPRHFT